MCSLARKKDVVLCQCKIIQFSIIEKENSVIVNVKGTNSFSK